MANNFFSNNSLVIYPKITKNKLVAIDYNLQTSYLRSYLNDKGISSSQYIQEQPSNLYDTVDDLTSFGSENTIFYVNMENYYLCRSLAIEMKNSGAAHKIIWVSDYNSSEFYKTMCRCEYADAYTQNYLDDTIYNLLTIDYDQWSEVHNIYLKTNSNNLPENSADIITDKYEQLFYLDNISSPYKANIMSIPLLSSVDIISTLIKTYSEKESYRLQHSVGRLIEDLNYISNNVSVSEINIVFKDQDLSTYEDYNILLNTICEKRYKFNFECTHSIKNLTSDNLKLLKMAGFKKIDVLVNESVSNKELVDFIKDITQSEPDGLIQISFKFKLSQKNIKERVEFISNLTSNKMLSLNDMKFFTHENIDYKNLDYLAMFETFSKDISLELLNMFSQTTYSIEGEYEKALLNGFMSFVTGMYPLNLSDNSVKHISMECDVLDSSIYEKLKEYTGLNSAIFAEHVFNKNLTETVYSKGDGILRCFDDKYIKNMIEAKKANYYLSNFHQLIKAENSNTFNLQINDFCRTNPLTINKIPYKELNSTSKDTIKFVEFESKEDVDIFLKNVSNFELTGIYQNEYELWINYVDSCRWSGDRVCSLTKLMRFKLGHNNEILPCGSCSKDLGTIDNGYFDAVQKAAIISENEHVERACSSCEIRHMCSKCSMLPDFLNKFDFCNIRKKHKILPYYIYYSNLLRDLCINSNLFKETPVKDIKISSYFKTHYFTDNIVTDNTPYLEPHVILITLKKMPVIYNSVSGKLLKLNEYMALMVELMIKGISKDNTISFLSEKFKLSYTDASKTLEQAYKYLFNAGCLKKGVIV